jgi:hypothetical protein
MHVLPATYHHYISHNTWLRKYLEPTLPSSVSTDKESATKYVLTSSLNIHMVLVCLKLSGDLKWQCSNSRSIHQFISITKGNILNILHVVGNFEDEIICANQ